MRITLIEENSADCIIKKIQYPNLEDIKSLNIVFKEDFDTLLLFEYALGTLDVNAHVSKIAFLKNKKLFVFFEYDNPEHQSFQRFICNENDYLDSSYSIVRDFFAEARHLQFQIKFSSSPHIKRKKI